VWIDGWMERKKSVDWLDWHFFKRSKGDEGKWMLWDDVREKRERASVCGLSSVALCGLLVLLCANLGRRNRSCPSVYISGEEHRLQASVCVIERKREQTLAETRAIASRDGLEVTATASASRLPAACLYRPVVCIVESEGRGVSVRANRSEGERVRAQLRILAEG